jgi:hypothetical protein
MDNAPYLLFDKFVLVASLDDDDDGEESSSCFPISRFNKFSRSNSKEHPSISAGFNWKEAFWHEVTILPHIHIHMEQHCEADADRETTL